MAGRLPHCFLCFFYLGNSFRQHGFAGRILQVITNVHTGKRNAAVDKFVFGIENSLNQHGGLDLIFNQTKGIGGELLREHVQFFLEDKCLYSVLQ